MQAFIFSGQGAQKQGMGQELVSSYTTAAHIYQHASEITGIDLLTLDQEQLSQTKYAQLAIITMSLAAWSVYKQEQAFIAEADTIAYAGFSLGEYSALCAAEVLTLSELLNLVALRSDLMQEAAAKQPGSMYAVIGLDDQTVERILTKPKYIDRVFPVNYNCPGQLVISGEAETADMAAEDIASSGARRVVKLNVNGAFHTPYMKSAAINLKEYASRLSFKRANGQIYSNFEAAAIAINPDWPQRLHDHMCNPVRWSSEIKQMKEDGYNRYIEFGPGKVLTGLIRKIDRNLSVCSVEDLKTLQSALKNQAKQRD